VLDSNNEITDTEPSSSERKGKRPSALRKTRKSDAEHDPPLSPSVKAELKKHKEKKQVRLKTDESEDYSETVALMSKTRKRIKHVPRVRVTVPIEPPALQTIKHTLNLDNFLLHSVKRKYFVDVLDARRKDTLQQRVQVL
jgi:SOS-response transcriptional repressor LexA